MDFPAAHGKPARPVPIVRKITFGKNSSVYPLRYRLNCQARPESGGAIMKMRGARLAALTSRVRRASTFGLFFAFSTAAGTEQLWMRRIGELR